MLIDQLMKRLASHFLFPPFYKYSVYYLSRITVKNRRYSVVDNQIELNAVNLTRKKQK